jgi:outer membrane lipoprotein SlyB
MTGSTPKTQCHRRLPSSSNSNNSNKATTTFATEPNTAARASHTAGHVSGVQAVESEKPTSGLGAVGGAVVGGLLGNQIGSGNGRILGLSRARQPAASAATMPRRS